MNEAPKARGRTFERTLKINIDAPKEFSHEDHMKLSQIAWEICEWGGRVFQIINVKNGEETISLADLRQPDSFNKTSDFIRGGLYFVLHFKTKELRNGNFFQTTYVEGGAILDEAGYAILPEKPEVLRGVKCIPREMTSEGCEEYLQELEVRLQKLFSSEFKSKLMIFRDLVDS